jgi:hypothetical protein
LKAVQKPIGDEPRENAAVPAPTINEPGPDWVPLARALFYYGDAGYLRSPEELERELRVTITRRAQGETEWVLEVSQSRIASIKALGWILRINCQDAAFWLESPEQKFYGLENSVHHLGPSSPQEFFTASSGWNTLSAEQEPAVGWHRNLTGSITKEFSWKLQRCLRLGAAHLMARKNTILAPFERITWEQWQYFKLTPEKKELASPYESVRDFSHDYDSRDLSSSAKGPAGETLYSIHVAPGEFSSKLDELNSEKECQQWLQRLMQENPERPPKPREFLIFSDLTLNGVSDLGEDNDSRR